MNHSKYNSYVTCFPSCLSSPHFSTGAAAGGDVLLGCWRRCWRRGRDLLSAGHMIRHQGASIGSHNLLEEGGGSQGVQGEVRGRGLERCQSPDLIKTSLSPPPLTHSPPSPPVSKGALPTIIPPPTHTASSSSLLLL